MTRIPVDLGHSRPLWALRCDSCGHTTPAFHDEGDLWGHAWDEGWQTVATLPRHFCPMCKGADR